MVVTNSPASVRTDTLGDNLDVMSLADDQQAIGEGKGEVGRDRRCVGGVGDTQPGVGWGRGAMTGRGGHGGRDHGCGRGSGFAQ
mmetsp:Transcript_52252/g.43851  ORF Transcript_52252/g.43851 Transcript_52252/m.43851 type:complete len:84 (-) Transcript_52252:61-312(-)